MGRRVVVATGNRHKVVEMAAVLGPLGFAVVSAVEAGGLPAVVEDGETFAANAAKKATEVAGWLRQPVLADDSGLEVEALGGRPGVFSARYAGEGAGDRANLEKLLGELVGVVNRRARFVCVIAVADADGRLLGVVEGEVAGRIIDTPRGQGGFGYDPVFVPDGHEETFAELAGEVKNSLSHRGAALRRLVATGWLESLASAAN